MHLLRLLQFDGDRMTAQKPLLLNLDLCLKHEAAAKLLSADDSLTVEQRALHAEEAEYWAQLAAAAVREQNVTTYH